MTRETKIGLLVGLAFIIVIGILLSDHMTSTTEPVAAPLANTAGNVRDSIAAPVTDPPPITVVTQNITPRDTVSAHNDPGPARSIVQVGPGHVDTIQIRQISAAHRTPEPGSNINIPVPQSDAPGSIADIARANGEPLVDAGSNPGNNLTNGSPAGTGGRKYTAQPGDTLSKLAGRFLGGNTKTNRDLIVKANSSLQSDPNKLIVGRTYIIPTAASEAAPAQSHPIAIAPPVPTGPVASAPVASDQPQFWYVVKENDSLWSIAADQLGNGTAWTAIKELNADILKGTDSIHPNMKLRLPAKPLASAQ